MTDPQRLTKYITATTDYSRREAEILVIDGWVSVNGHIIDRPQHMVNPSDVISIDPHASLTPSAPVTLLMHKPVDYYTDSVDIATISQANQAKKLINLDSQMPYDRSPLTLQHKYLRNLQCVYGLEGFASGLVIYTQDASLVRRLTDNNYLAEHEYTVGVSGTMAENGLSTLNQLTSVTTTLSRSKPSAKLSIKVSWQNETHLRIAGKGLQVGDITLLCARVGLTVTSIKRLRIGRIPLGQLAVGQWRFLLGHEKF